MEFWVTIMLLLTSGLIVGLLVRSLKRPFFLLSEFSVKLLDVILSNPSSEGQVNVLNSVTRKVTCSLIVLLVLSCSLFLVYFNVIKLITGLFRAAPISFELGLFISGFISLVPLVNFPGEKVKYSDLNKLLHRLILNNYHVGRMFLRWQVRNFDDSIDNGRVIGLIVSGLARSGTTALTHGLERSRDFKSLDYSNMPFVLAPRFWKYFYNPSSSGEKVERLQSDGIEIGLNEVEALEEVFFINLLNSDYVKESCLEAHSIPPAVNSLYRRYIKSIANEKLYLAKNNNFVLRGISFMKQNPDIKVVILFRDPLEHANSLMKQHERFNILQDHDEFVLEYMNFIGHHEFGLGMKPFNLGANKARATYSPDSVNFWLELWLKYYSAILKLEGVRIVCYEEFCRNPNEVLNDIQEFVGISQVFHDERPFKLKKTEINDVDIYLEREVLELYTELLKLSAVS